MSGQLDEWSTAEVHGYRIGWGRLSRIFAEYRRLVPMIAAGKQGDGQRVKRTRWLPKVRRDAWTVLTHHPKYLLHRPWQAEYDGPLRFARRGLTRRAAERRMIHDVEHEMRTGRRAPYQAWRWRLARGWDRRNLPSGVAE